VYREEGSFIILLRCRRVLVLPTTPLDDDGDRAKGGMMAAQYSVLSSVPHTTLMPLAVAAASASSPPHAPCLSSVDSDDV
jgi:hypothetical protein